MSFSVSECWIERFLFRTSKPLQGKQKLRESFEVAQATQAFQTSAYFCIKHFFWVHKCAKGIHTEKYAKKQWVWWKGVSLLDKVNIC